MPKNNLKLANEWVVKSQNDLKSAEILYDELEFSKKVVQFVVNKILILP